MVVFNGTAIIQLIVAAIPGGIAYGIAYLAGGNVDDWAFAFLLGTWFLLDALWRVANVFPDEDDPESGGILNLVMPGGGGHIFFVPGWLVAIVVGVIKVQAAMGRG